MPSSSSKSFLKTSYKPISSSSSRRGKTDDTYIYVIIAVFLFAIITGTIVYSSYRNEKFTNPESKLVYLYMSGCVHCKDFDNEWVKIEDDNENKEKYNIKVDKLDLNEKGKSIAADNKINYAPAIILLKSDGTNIIYEGKRTKDEIYKWIEEAIKNK